MIIQLSVSWSSISLEGFRCFLIVSFKNVCQVKRVPDRMQVTSCEKDAVQSHVKSLVFKQNLTCSITSHQPKAAKECLKQRGKQSSGIDTIK